MQYKQENIVSPASHVKAISETSTGSETTSTNGSGTATRFMCFLATKSSKLCQYELDVSETNLSIISSFKQKVKSTLLTQTIHVKEIPKQPREVSDSDLETVDESQPKVQLPAQAATAPEEAKQLFWYPVKLVLPKNKSRTVFTESRKARKELISAVLAAQGFANALD